MALTIKLVRHGESRANTGEMVAHEVGDHAIALSERGHQQARAIGASLGAEFVRRALMYVSPYRRARDVEATYLRISSRRRITSSNDARSAGV